MRIDYWSSDVCSSDLQCIERHGRSAWGDRGVSNPRQPESQSGTLPTELRSPSFFTPASTRVKRTGFEHELRKQAQCSLSKKFSLFQTRDSPDTGRHNRP